ncbi:unnamed protein product [Owenia fusiformis]|uniref:Uncharacterized protein n=1 Tax=Owenia fusiformis TaxID=6347 RepID=A0A8J1YBQ1_OWEFU|nr:unnamed protein product [Owenia fusiformis]
MMCVLTDGCLHFQYNKISEECQLLRSEWLEPGVDSYPSSNDWTLWELQWGCGMSEASCPKTAPCPSGFVFSNCGSCYWFETDSQLDYETASQNCRDKYGSSLLSLETKKELRAMEEYLISQGLQNLGDFLTSGKSTESERGYTAEFKIQWSFNMGVISHTAAQSDIFLRTLSHYYT